VRPRSVSLRAKQNARSPLHLPIPNWARPPQVLGEDALWFAHRGTARVQLDRHVDAAADLNRALASDPREWVSARIHTALGELAVRRGQPRRAACEFAMALRFAISGGDQRTAREAREKLRAPGR
jgi:hypothetical protein